MVIIGRMIYFCIVKLIDKILMSNIVIFAVIMYSSIITVINININ